jgi:hypothetical protein
MKKIILNPRFFIPVLLALSILYRAILVAAFPQPFVADQTQYHDIALGILKNGIFANANRTYGYPMIVAFWYAVFGSGNVLAWTLIQVCMDACIAVFIYFTAKDIFGKKMPATIAFLLYCMSPFVAAYAGMLLTEVSAVFYMAFFFLLWHKFFLTKKVIYLLPAAFLMGYIPEIRPVFFYFMVALFITTLFLIRNMAIQRRGWVLVIVCFLLPFSYAFAGNYLLFHRITPLVADDGGFASELVGSQYLEGRAPHPIDKPGGWPDRIGQLGWDLRFPYEREYRENLKKERMKEAIGIIQKDPWHFFRVRLNKAWYIWEKHYLFIFSQEPRFIEIAAYALNTVLLASAAFGMLCFGMRKRAFHQKLFLWMSVALIAYTSCVHMISDGEERYSLPVYPVLFIFCGYALSIVGAWIWKNALPLMQSKE